ncbi:MAG: hypothetical protein VST70_00905 [Nitrospirota bacterium]|nr:hypothetical protein [Nitrospirota bacterium]
MIELDDRFHDTAPLFFPSSIFLGELKDLETGASDLLFAFFVGNRSGLKAGQLEAMYFIPTIFVPLALITRGMIFRILLGRTNEPAMRVHVSS